MAGNTAYVATRAKSRRKNLADLPRMRQLIHQSPDQLTVAVSNIGYADEINLYAGTLSGGDLVEAALTHNLSAELNEIVSMCSGKIREMIEVYTSRFEYQNAKVVFRAVINDVELEKVSHSILPELNDINTPWLKIIENSDDLRSAAIQMRRKPFGSALIALPDDARLSDYEDALDRHYFSKALKSLSGGKPASRFLRNYIGLEIDHRNILNILESNSMGIDSEEISNLLISGGKLLPSSAFSAIAAGGKASLIDILRTSNRFEFAEFEQLLAQSEEVRSLDPVVTWFKKQEHDFMQKMSYLHPVSALPIVYYIAMKVQEVADLRLIVRGRLAGLPEDVLEAHIL